MTDKESLHLCMGSACHQLGVYHLLPALQELISRYQLEDRLELKGAFCMGPCQHGVTMKFRGSLTTDLRVDNLEEKFIEAVVHSLEEPLVSETEE